MAHQNGSSCKNSLLFEVVNNFNKKLHIKIYYWELKYSLFIVNVIKCYLMAYLCRTPSRRYIYGSFCKTLVCNCANDLPYGMFFTEHPMGCSSLFVYNLLWDVIFYSYYFIAVPIRKTCSMSLMRFNNCTFYVLFYFIADFKQVLTMF